MSEDYEFQIESDSEHSDSEPQVQKEEVKRPHVKIQTKTRSQPVSYMTDPETGAKIRLRKDGQPDRRCLTSRKNLEKARQKIVDAANSEEMKAVKRVARKKALKPTLPPPEESEEDDEEDMPLDDEPKPKSKAKPKSKSRRLKTRSYSTQGGNKVVSDDEEDEPVSQVAEALRKTTLNQSGGGSDMWWMNQSAPSIII